MNIVKLAAAAALALSSLAVPAAAVAAQHNDRDRGGNYDRDGDRDRGGHYDRGGGRWHNDNGRHNGWRNNRRVCRWVWRHHHRTRICTWRRWR